MAQLKDSIVSGNLRVTDEILTNLLQTGILRIPTSSGGTTYGLGTNGQIIKSNGSSVYWADDNNTNYYHSTGSWSGLTYTATANGGAPALAFTLPTGTTSTTVALGNHNHDDTYLKLSGGTMTGAIAFDSSTTSRLDTAENLTNESVASPGYVVGLTTGWGKFGYTTIAQLKSTMSLNKVTNNKQVKGLSSGTTSGHIVTWGSDGYTVADSGYTIESSVPANAVFTDTKVTQINTTNTTEDDSYRILFSNTADNTSRTEAARKSAYLLFTPNSKTLTTTNLSVTDNLYIGRSGSTTGKIYFFSTSNNTSMYGRIEQTFNPTQSNPVHKLPSTSGTLLNDTDFNEIHEVIFDDTNSGTTATNPIDFDITDEIDRIKYIDILYTDTNYQKTVNGYNIKQKSENFGFLRIPFDKVRYTYSISANVPSTLFSLSLIGDKNSYYIRKQTYALSIVQSGSQQTDPTYTLDIREFNSGLVIQFYGTPGTGTYANMTTRAQYTNAIRILKVVLIKELKEQQ